MLLSRYTFTENSVLKLVAKYIEEDILVKVGFAIFVANKVCIANEFLYSETL